MSALLSTAVSNGGFLVIVFVVLFCVSHSTGHTTQQLALQLQKSFLWNSLIAKVGEILLYAV
eukprot:XP_001705305.1 Hypothetical protein GL50803_35571 [Giardia lamblia ATCC 50803]